MNAAASHIKPSSEIPVDVWLSDDPSLALVHADMNEWADAHPCDCHALCKCDTQEARTRDGKGKP